LPRYYISRYPVTVAQFDAFVQAGGYAEARYWPEAQAAGEWQAKGIRDYDDQPRTAFPDYGEPFNLPNHPVVGITWYEALAFCRWLEELLQATDSGMQLWKANRLTSMNMPPGAFKVQLPSEAEWEKAARGGLEIPWGETGIQRENPDPARRYPWGQKPDPERANFDEARIEATSAVGCFPEGASPYGVEDLSGNVWEWTRSHWKAYPYDPTDGREDLTADDLTPRVERGGAFGYDEWCARCAFRYWRDPFFRRWNQGFRVVLFLSTLDSVSLDSDPLDSDL